MTDLSIGYDPARIRALGRRTSDSIRALDAIHSTDPAAADAMRVVRLIRQNLSDQWMPLIREIESSTSMTNWTSRSPDAHRFPSSGAAWLTHHAGDRTNARRSPPAAQIVVADQAFRKLLSKLDDEELLDRLEDMCDAQARAGIRIDPTDPAWASMLAALAAELDDRLGHDTDGSFGRSLLDVARQAPMIALAAPYSSRLSALAYDLAIAMLRVESWVPELHPVNYESGVDALLGLLDDSPAACLDLLLDETVLGNLAAWSSLDSDVVGDVVMNGLQTAITADPQRLADGYAVLGSLTELANGRLDGGFAPGMARGVADSLTAYMDTLAPAIRYEGDDPVTVHSFDPDFTIRLGTYDELVDLFGALLRDQAAQASIGVTLGAYTDHIVTDLGEHVDDHVGIEYVARFTDLISDAARTEQAEIVLVAAAAAARRERIGTYFSSGLTIALGPAASFPGHVVRATARSLFEAGGFEAGGAAGPGRSDEVADNSIGSTIHRHITVAVLERVSSDPAARTGEFLERVTDDQWALLREHLDDIEAAGDDLTERHGRVDRMERYIEQFIPPLGGYLRTVRSAPGVNELEETRAATGADDDR